MPADGISDLVELHRSHLASWTDVVMGGNTHALRQHDQTIGDWLALWLQCRLNMPA
jgi:hypothetical protein